MSIICLLVAVVRGNTVSVIFYLVFVQQEKMSDWISVLQERSENIEDLVSELELAYNSVEVNHALFASITFDI